MATKVENIEKLKALGVELTGKEDAKELAALVKTHSVADAKEQKDAEIKKSAEGDLTEAEAVDVLRDEGRIYIRTYSREIHGDDFLSLAKQFQQGHPTVLIVDTKVIEQVVVQYREKEDYEKPLKDQNPDAPQVEKERVFTDKEEALAFCAAKKGTISVKRK